jgi:hypothetical protein
MPKYEGLRRFAEAARQTQTKGLGSTAHLFIETDGQLSASGRTDQRALYGQELSRLVEQERQAAPTFQQRQALGRAAQEVRAMRMTTAADELVPGGGQAVQNILMSPTEQKVQAYARLQRLTAGGDRENG